MDDGGYPTEEFLDFVKQYEPDESLPVMDFIEKVISTAWMHRGFKLHRKYRGIRKLELHTGGWSGNEETIGAITSNIYLTHFKMKYVMWRTGGHYYFEIRG